MTARPRPQGPTLTRLSMGAAAWRVYRTLFIAQLVSNIGLWMQTVGSQWFLVEQNSSATVDALVQTASLLPPCSSPSTPADSPICSIGAGC